MVVHYRSLFRPIVHCSPNDCFSFHKIPQNIAVYVNCKRITKKILEYFEFATSSDKLLIQQEKPWCSWRFQNNVSTLNL